MTDSEMLHSLVKAADEHRRIIKEGVAADRAQVEAMPSEVELWTDGKRRIVSVRGDIFEEHGLLVLFVSGGWTTSNGYEQARKCVRSFTAQKCMAETGLPPEFLRRKDCCQLVYYKQTDESWPLNGRDARRTYVRMLDSVASVHADTISILGINTWGHSEFDCFDSVQKWLQSNSDSAIREVRLVDLHGSYHELSLHFVRLRPQYNPYDNTENFPIWKMMGRPFI